MDYGPKKHTSAQGEYCDQALFIPPPEISEVGKSMDEVSNPSETLLGLAFSVSCPSKKR
jgi:hypothetical protein